MRRARTNAQPRHLLICNNICVNVDDTYRQSPKDPSNKPYARPIVVIETIVRVCLHLPHRCGGRRWKYRQVVRADRPSRSRSDGPSRPNLMMLLNQFIRSLAPITFESSLPLLVGVRVQRVLLINRESIVADSVYATPANTLVSLRM